MIDAGTFPPALHHDRPAQLAIHHTAFPGPPRVLNAGSRGTARLLVDAPGDVLNAGSAFGPALRIGRIGGALPRICLPGIAGSRGITLLLRNWGQLAHRVPQQIS
jgi:hypothetical protein